MKIEFYKTKYYLDYYLILLTPVIDTINGYVLRTYGVSDGFSIGTIYRMTLLIYIILRSLKSKNVMTNILLAFYFPILGLIKGLYGSGLFACLSYGTKWLLPIALINYYAFIKQDKAEISRCMVKVFDFWSVFVPVSLIIEYIFKLGVDAYYNSGFKGYYYSTNDIALVLIVLFIYELHKFFTMKHYKDLILCVLNFVAIIILSAKSSMIFAIITVIFMVFKYSQVKLKNVLAFIAILVVGMLIFRGLNTEIERFMDRYLTMWTISGGESLLNKFFIFATSGRTERITYFFDKINDGWFPGNLFWGWIIPDNANVIEMDWHDLLCQYGLVGFAICAYEYIKLFIKGFKGEAPYLYIVVICFTYSILAGHVLSGAFSGTCFSIAFSLLIASRYNNTEKRSVSK